MGTSFVNIQVFAGSRPPVEMRADVIEAIRHIILAGPFAEVESEAEFADQIVEIGPAGDEPWIAVFDDLMDDGPAVEQFATALSAALETTVLGMYEYESMWLELYLRHNDAEIDTFMSSSDDDGGEDDLDESPREQPTRLPGHPERWRDVLAPGATPDDLRRVWDDESLYADDVATRVALLLGLKHLMDSVPYSHAADEPQSTYLRFRYTGSDASLARASGPPVLSLSAYSERLECVAGREETLALVSVENQGGPLRGLRLVVWGEALERGLVEPATAEISTPDHEDTVELALKPDRAEDASVRTATIEDFELPAGLLHPEYWDPDIPKELRNRRHAVLQTIDFHVNVRGVARAPGRGELHIGFVPIQNPEAGQTVWSGQVDVRGILRRPLRGSADERDLLAYLDAIDNPHRLVALVALGADRMTCAQVAGEAIERWHTLFCVGSTGRYELVLQPAQRRRITTSYVPAKSILHDHPHWQDLRSALATCLHIGLRPEGENPDSAPLEGASGFAFDAASVSFEGTDDQQAPHLVFWLDDSQLAPIGEAAALEALERLIDDVMGAGNGLQAFVAHWNWYFCSRPNSTPYEQACGVGASFTTGRAWCSRFLRGVSERMWLGPELLAHLGARAELEIVADVKPVGDGVRITLKKPANLDDLERLLVPLLPGREDWLESYDRLYKRTL